MGNVIFAVVGLVILAAVLYYVLVVRKKDDAAPEVDEPRAQKPALKAKTEEPKKPAPKDAPKTESKAAGEKPAPKATEAKTEAKKPAAKVAEPAPAKVPAAPPIERGTPKVEKEPEPAEEADVEIAPPPAARTAAGTPLAKRTKDVAGLRRGLAKARESEGFFGKLKSLFSGKKEIDPQIVDQIEEVLLTSDVGVKTTSELVEAIREELSKGELKNEEKVWSALRSKAESILDLPGGGISFGTQPTVVMVVGVNGVGKTTTIGKLATRLVQQNKKVVLAAGDTFRAAAVHQLGVWAKRAGCEVVTGAEGSNAGAVIFDAIKKAKEIGADVVLADTAGRLHTKTNLMEELKKIGKTMGKAMEGAPHETLLVLDATNGQNAIQQTALFSEAMPLTGIVLTKLDGTAKGGVILGICAEHKVPVRYIGVGERAEDLRDFQADEFVEALLGGTAEASEKAA